MTTPQITTIALASLRESPFNPRTIYSDADLAELAQNLRTQGLLQPLLVRPLRSTDRDIQHTHEVVFGHRRLRAAALVPLEPMHCIVRDMTDAEAAVAQVHENGQRADITALEEADAYARLRADHGLSVDDIAQAIGKSASHVYARLKLTAPPPATGAAPAPRPAALRRAVAYRCPDTGMTWSGKGLQPRWLKAAMAQGKRLADFAVAA